MRNEYIHRVSETTRAPCRKLNGNKSKRAAFDQVPGETNQETRTRADETRGSGQR